MWILYFILFVPSLNLQVTTPLNHYDTPEECARELADVRRDMNQAYPEDVTNQVFVCTEINVETE